MESHKQDLLLETLKNCVQSNSFTTDSCPIKIIIEPPEFLSHPSQKSGIQHIDSQMKSKLLPDQTQDCFSDANEIESKPLDTNFQMQSQEVNICDSSDVHFGNKLVDNRQITVEKANNVNTYFSVYLPEYALPPAPPITPTRPPTPPPSDHIQRVVQFLRDFYKINLSLTTPLPWCSDFTLCLKEFYVGVQIVRARRRGESFVHHGISLEELIMPPNYLDGDDDQPLRLLVEGNPGYGKTTIAIRISTDWARGAPYLQAFSLLFLIQLREFQGDLQQYLFKERYPLEEEIGREEFWEYIVKNRSKVLLVLDGLDELIAEHQMPIVELLQGHLLNGISVIVTTRPLQSGNDLIRTFPTRVILQGFTNEQITNFINKYFVNNTQNAEKLNNLIFNPDFMVYRTLSACPLMCQLLCVLFEDKGGNLPTTVTDVYMSLIKCLLTRSLFRKGETTAFLQEIPEKHDKMLVQFGRSCLYALTENRVVFTSEEVSTIFSGSSLLEFGFLIKDYELSLNRQHRVGCLEDRNQSYQPLHKTFIEFLAAYYLKSLLKSPDQHGQFSKDLEILQPASLTSSVNPNNTVGRPKFSSTFLVLKFLTGLLGDDTHKILPQILSSFNLQPVFLFDLLKESGTLSQNASLLTSLLDKETIVVYSSDLELQGWGHVIVDSSCIIKCLEFQKTMPCSEDALENFFAALAVNISIETLIIECPYSPSIDMAELNRFCHYIGLSIRKKNLRRFVFKCPIHGDAMDMEQYEKVSEPFIDTMCSTIQSYRPDSLQSLQLDIDLNSTQMLRLRRALLCAPQLTALNVSKLWCGVQGFQAIADLIVSHPKLAKLNVSFNLSKVWSLPPTVGEDQLGSPTDLKDLNTLLPKEARRRSRVMDPQDESDPLVCPCGCDCDIITPGSSNHGRVVSASERLELAPFLKLFESNDRVKLHFLKDTGYIDMKVPYGYGTRTCRFPVPLCVAHQGGFHHLLSTLKHPQCFLTHLNINYRYLAPTDCACLGDALRKTKTLESLKLEDQQLDRLLPILAGLSQNRTIQVLDLSSRDITMDDARFQYFCRCLQDNTVIRRIALCDWTFTIVESRSFQSFARLMSTTQVDKLILRHCHIDIVTDSITNREILYTAMKTMPNISSLEHINLDGAKVTFNNYTLTGALLLPFLCCCTGLKELDLSVKPPCALTGNALLVDDEMTIEYFSGLSKWFGRSLTTLHMCHWRFCIDQPKKTPQAIASYIHSLDKLTILKLNHSQCNSLESNHVSLSNRGENSVKKVCILGTIISKCPNLKMLSIFRMSLTAEQGKWLGSQVKDRWNGSLLIIRATFIPEAALRQLLLTLMSSKGLVVDYVGGKQSDIIIKSKTGFLGRIFSSYRTRSKD